VSQLLPAERAAARAASHHGQITSQHCRDCGLSPSAVRRLVASRPGIVACRSVLLGRWGKRVPDTEFARLFGLLIDDAGLPEPVYEHEVKAGGATYSIDAAYPPASIAIELDGKGHATEAAFEADPVRENRLKLSGWTVLRYTWHRFITAPGEVVAEVRQALGQAGALPPAARAPNRCAKAPKTGASERRNGIPARTQPPEGPP
jgi:Protein of unknown function (DUF559)